MEAVASSLASRPRPLVVPSTRIDNYQAHHRFFPTPRPLHNPHFTWKFQVSTTIGGQFMNPLRCAMCDVSGRTRRHKAVTGAEGTSTCCGINIHKIISWQEKFKHNISIILVRLVASVMLVMSMYLIVCKAPSLALTEENRLFLEAWRTVDRAYYDKTFNGQSWFRYRENALRNEPMNTREETYMAIRKMLSTLDDPFTRFLEPEKFKSLRSGTQGALTGVGLSIGYPMMINGSATGLVVISSSPGGPANRAGIVSGDVILAIDDASTEDMDIYDAADRLQGAEGSSVKLAIHSGSEIRNFVLKREKVTLNPVKSRVCEIADSGMYNYRIGYIKLTSFNQNASAFEDWNPQVLPYGGNCILSCMAHGYYKAMPVILLLFEIPMVH